LFENLCGKNPLKSVVIVTTMWSLIEDEKIGQSREQELTSDMDFFRPIIQQGARLERHKDTKESAQSIIRLLLTQSPEKEKLDIQIEMVDEKLRLDETKAAAQLMQDFDRLIHFLENKIEEEKATMVNSVGDEKREKTREIKRLTQAIEEIKERKATIGRNRDSVPLQKRFLKWFKRFGLKYWHR
jgi:hypothetical protein